MHVHDSQMLPKLENKVTHCDGADQIHAFVLLKIHATKNLNKYAEQKGAERVRGGVLD